MIRFLILCVVFFLLYIGFSTIGDYDSGIKFSVYDYQIETTLFVFLTVFVFTQLFLMVALKLIFLIFDLPTILKKRWYRRKLLKINNRLLNVLAELLMGNKKKSLKITSNILSELDEENKDFEFKLDRFYFSHSYRFNVSREILFAETISFRIPAIIKKENVIGVQFHPEKSGNFGLNFLNNFAQR